MRTFSLALLILAIVPASARADTPKRAPAKLQVTSPAFKQNGPIPRELTCDGANVAPQLSWSTVPTGTKSVALLVDDPDATRGTFTHWLVTGIPTTVTSLDGYALPPGALTQNNDNGMPGYTGPCPPSGRYRYWFTVYALDIILLTVITRDQLLTSARGHVLATGQLVGTYERTGGR